MRTVPGRTDRIVVVGAGLAGLSAALRLRGAGREVTVVERGPGPGGRAGRVERDGYALDTGPSVFTAPELVGDALAAVGEKLEERLTLLPLETTYRAQYADGSHLDVHADPDAFADEVAALCGPAEADALRRYLADLAELYRLQLGTFIDRNLDSPLDLLGPELVTLARRGGFGRLSRHVERYFADDRLRRLFSFQALYAGVSPFRAIAAYAVIAQLDIGAGVWHPVGGIAAVPRALAAAAADAGVDLPVRRRRRRARDVGTAGHRGPADRTASGCPRTPSSSPPTSRTRLVPGLRPPRRPVYSPSCVALHLGVRARAARPGAPHDQLRELVARRVRRADPRRAPDDRPQPAGQHAVAHRPQPRARRRPGAEHRRAHAQPRPAQRRQPRPRLDGARPPLPRRGAGHPGGARLDGPHRRDRGRGDGHPAGLGRPGHGGRHPVRPGPHLRADRPVPALDPAPPRAGERRPRRLVGAAGRGRPDGADQRAAGRRADHRTGAGDDRRRPRRQERAGRAPTGTARPSTPGSARATTWPPGC